MTILRQLLIFVVGLVLGGYTGLVVSNPIPMLIVLLAAGYVVAWYDWRERDEKYGRVRDVREPLQPDP